MMKDSYNFKNIISLFFILLFIFSCNNSNEEDKEYSEEKAGEHVMLPTLIIEGTDILVRSKPSTTGKVIMKLDDGDICEIMEKGEFEQIREMQDYWYKIRFNGKDGWVYGSQTSVKKAELSEYQEKVVDTAISQDVIAVESLDRTKTEKVLNESALQLPDEEIIFSFKSEKGKTMNILLQKDKKYLVYRFGTEQKTELQFPEELSNTFEQFSYSYYFRGGGAANAGLDLNYLSFSGDTHKFIIFQEYSAEGEEGDGEQSAVGIRIVDLKTNKEFEISGINSTVSGDLSVFRDNGLVKIIEEL